LEYALELEKVKNIRPYGLQKTEKAALYRNALSSLTLLHYDGCLEYRRILDAYGIDPHVERAAEEQPMIPVRLFKELELRSVPPENIVKTMTSSGTGGQAVSKIFLDRENAKNQTVALTRIITSFIGKERLPLLIFDTEQVKTDRSMYSARGAGIIGFSTFGVDTTFALDRDMKFDTAKVSAFLEKHSGKPILMFGYTYMIWQYVACALKERGESLNIPDGLLFHIGGWKKLRDQSVDAKTFNSEVAAACGAVRVYNYYGMAEQLGSVFVECEQGHMHCSVYSDVIIRRLRDFSAAGFNERGLIELLSLLPSSYPGHILLTEDEGEILGEDDCVCGRLGKYFRIHGRVKGAELRGCSDVQRT
jgi:phenylacetate-coenzyme A ligase PaaK-like adenylate-forming protein